VRVTAIGWLLRELALRYRAGRDAIPQQQWRAWTRSVATGFAGMLLLMLLLRFVAPLALDAGLHDYEIALLRRLSADPPIRFSTAVFLQTFGSDITLAMLVAFTAGIALWIRRPVTSLSIILAAIVPDIVGRFGWMIWSRARPDILYEGIASPGFHAFPSGHAAKTFAVYGFLTLLWIRASANTLEKSVAILLFAFIAIGVGLGRVLMGVHWPSDVIGGMVIGAVWVFVLRKGLGKETNYSPQRRGVRGEHPSTK